MKQNILLRVVPCGLLLVPLPPPFNSPSTTTIFLQNDCYEIQDRNENTLLEATLPLQPHQIDAEQTFAAASIPITASYAIFFSGEGRLAVCQAIGCPIAKSREDVNGASAIR